METLRIIKKLSKIQSLTLGEERATAAALNNSAAVIGCITDYLNSEIAHIDKQLGNPKSLYDHAGADRYVAFKLAERATNLELLRLLSEKVTIIDDDQSGVYNV